MTRRAGKDHAMTVRDFHYYEPAKGHGLSHNPLNALVAPRPIGWISSRDAQGRVNLAPYSFFNAFNYDPRSSDFLRSPGKIAFKTHLKRASSPGTWSPASSASRETGSW